MVGLLSQVRIILAGITCPPLACRARDPGCGGDYSKKAGISLRSMRLFVFPMFLKSKLFRHIKKTKSHPPDGGWAFLLSRDAGI